MGDTFHLVYDFNLRREFMKKVVICILIICICLSISACGEKILKDNNESDKQVGTLSTDGAKNNSPTPAESQSSNHTKDIKPLELLDFSVSDTKNSIRLDSPYKEFKIDKPEEKLENNYVGETYSGEFVYKTYMHKYADFDLYVSNANYNLKNRNFDEYYITQITLKNSTFKTYRGISIGSKVEDINKAYGPGEKSTVDGKNVLIYTLNDMEMSFTIDENQKVQDVVLRIIVKDIQ